MARRNADQEVYPTHSVIYENVALIVELEDGTLATVMKDEVVVERGNCAPAVRFKPRGSFRVFLRDREAILERFNALPGVSEGSVRVFSIAHEIIVERSNPPPALQELPMPLGLGAYITLRVIGQDGNISLLLLRRRTRLRNLMNAYCDRQAVELNAITFLYNGRHLRGDQTPDESNIVQDPTMPREMIESLKQQAELDDKSSKSERNREITMELPAYGSKTTPDTYSLVHTDFPGPVYIFSETSEGKVVVDGLVYQKYDSKPSLNSFRKYTVPTKGSKIKECSGNEQNKPQMLNLTVPGNEKRTGHPLKNQQNKKVRMDPDKLQEVLFVLFEKQPRYTFTELVSQTAQPQDFLKKSLDQICVKVKEGGKTFYEIKPEYKGQGHN